MRVESVTRVSIKVCAGLGLTAFFFLVSLFLNDPGLNAAMYYDSAARMLKNTPLFESGLRGALSIFPQRPIPMLSFYGDYLLWGMEPAYYRCVNIALLSLTGLTAFILLRLIMETPAVAHRSSSRDRTVLAFLLAALYVFHPLQTFLTLYIWQRTALMACLFYFAALAVYLAVRLGKIDNRPLGYLCCLILFLCAMLSKENSLTLPMACVLAEVAFFREGCKDVGLRAAIAIAATIAAVMLMGLLEHPHGKERLGSGVLSTVAYYYDQAGVGLLQVIWTQCRVTVLYLAMVFFPTPSLVQLTRPQVISQSFLEPSETLYACLIVAALVAVGLVLLRRRPLTGFGVLFFLGNLLPESLLVPQYAFFGYRPILPMLGALLFVADMAIFACERAPAERAYRLTRRAILGIWVIAILLFAVSTHIRAELWSDKVAFWSDVANRLPASNDHLERRSSSQALNNLAAALKLQGALHEALAHHRRAAELLPEDSRNHSAVGLLSMRMGYLEEAERALRRAVELDPDNAFLHWNLGQLLSKRGETEEALEHYREAARLAPNNKRFAESLAEMLGK